MNLFKKYITWPLIAIFVFVTFPVIASGPSGTTAMGTTLPEKSKQQREVFHFWSFDRSLDVEEEHEIQELDFFKGSLTLANFVNSYFKKGSLVELKDSKSYLSLSELPCSPRGPPLFS